MTWRKGVNIGIPTYNGAHRVEGLLENLRQRTSPSVPYEIWVADDSGRPEHQEKVRQICIRYGVHLAINPVNKGLPATWNVLVRSTDHEKVVLLNDDVLMAKDWLSYIDYAIEKNPGVGSVGMNFRFIEPRDAFQILQGPDAKVIPLNVRYVNGNLVRNERFSSMPEQVDEAPGKVMCPPGCGFGFLRSTYERVGGFDERYRCFYEETDFGVACAQIGMPAITLPVPHDNYHMWSATFASAPEIPASSIMADSRRKFIEKWSQILGTKFNDAPDIHPLLMDKIQPFPVRWLGVNKREREVIL